MAIKRDPSTPWRRAVIGRVPLLGLIAAIAVAYVAAAQIGMALTFENHVSSAIWPPAGIAVAAFVLWGGRIWPAVFLGAAMGHVQHYGPSITLVAFAIAAAKTLAPWLAAKALRAVGFGGAFQTPRDVLLFALCGGAAPMMIAPTVGVTSLVLGHVIPLSAALQNWWTWWVGDTLGVLVVGPLLLTWIMNPHLKCSGLRSLEVIAAFMTLALVCTMYLTSDAPRLYVFFPLVLWGVLRFSQRENATTIFLVATVVAWGAIGAPAPAFSTSSGDRLTTLGLFFAIFAITTLTGGAAIAERRRCEGRRLRAGAELLIESESRFRGAFESAAIGMALVSLDGRWMRVNTALSRMLGYDKAELLATDFQSITHPDDLDQDLANVQSLLEGWTHDYHIEKRYIHKNGRVVHALLGVSLARGADGMPLHFVSQIQDVTARRQMEDKLRAAQKMEAVGQLTAGIAHDFNNLLSVVSLNLELISGELGQKSFCGSRAKIALNACDRGARLTRQLLAFARKQTLSPRDHDVAALLRGSIQLLRHALPNSISIEIESDAAGAGTVTIDHIQFDNVILNIALNARDAMAAGGVLRFACAARDIGRGDSVLLPGRYAEITIRDTGTGMPPDVLARAFEPFFSTKPFAQGSGLGLSMAYGFVNQSGGEIRIASTEGQGTTVTILLPVTYGAAVTRGTTPSATTSISFMLKHALLVEDIDDVRDVIALQLEIMGFDVVTASRGDAALKLIESTAFDVLITDMGLPGDIQGERLADLAGALRPELRILTMTGYNEPAPAVATATNACRRLHLQKPFTQEQMRAVLGELLTTSDIDGHPLTE